MSTKFLRNADTFQLVSSDALNVHDKLPPGNYLIRKDPQTGALYLQFTEAFQHPPKMYGHTMQHAERIMSTFKDRPAGTGVLLSGQKGSGKTLLARTVCIELAKQGVPTIIINQPWAGDAFYSFITSITQPCILLIDEFEKVYSNKDDNSNKPYGSSGSGAAQAPVLTLLDGVFPTKKLFLLTCNDRWAINENMINRPGRVFYTKEFHGLDADFIREYASDTLKDQSQIDAVCRVANFFHDFNFDMLKSLIEEMNRYGESVGDALQLLNVSPERDFAEYRVNVLLHSGETIVNEHTSPNEIRNPLGMKKGISIWVYTRAKPEEMSNPDDADDKGPLKRRRVMFYPADVLSVDNDKMVLRNKEGDVLNLTRMRFEDKSWRSMVTAL